MVQLWCSFFISLSLTHSFSHKNTQHGVLRMYLNLRELNSAWMYIKIIWDASAACLPIPFYLLPRLLHEQHCRHIKSIWEITFSTGDNWIFVPRLNSVIQWMMIIGCIGDDDDHFIFRFKVIKAVIIITKNLIILSIFKERINFIFKLKQKKVSHERQKKSLVISRGVWNFFYSLRNIVVFA